MVVPEQYFQKVMAAMQTQLQNLDRALNARIALAETEVLRLRCLRDEGTEFGKSGILDARKIDSQKLALARGPQGHGALASMDRARLALGEDAAN